MKVLILAGGSGKRLWPLTDPPKQFRCFGSLLSLLQQTLTRFLKRYSPKDMYVVVSRAHEAIARVQCAAIHPILARQLIVEPEPKNTASAIAYALNDLGDRVGDRFLIVPSDHLIQPEDHFLDRLAFAEKHLPAETHGLFGVTPSSPHTGYGYIARKCPSLFTQVTSFHEKPNEKQARHMIQNGCLWNTGIILFHTETLRRALPREVPAISIDYLLLEHASNLCVTHLDLAWSDLGTWEGIYAAYDKDVNGNVIFGNVQTSGVQNCLVFGGEEPEYLYGLENDVVILSETREKILMPFSTQIPSPL